MDYQMNTPQCTKPSPSCSLGEKGFSLIEVIIALAVLTIGILAVNAMQTVSIRGNKTANDITMATGWSSDEVERILQINYDNIKDTNGNGLGPDVNNNGIDDDDEGMPGDGLSNFGLDDTAVVDATLANDPDGDFTIIYNVKEEYPLPDLKTVNVISTSKTDKSVAIKYIIAKNI